MARGGFKNTLTPRQAGLKRRARRGKQGETRVSLRLVAEQAEHRAAAERVLERALGPGRLAKTSERVRERGARFEPALSRVALNASGEVVGLCRIWRIEVGAPVYFLGPLAVDPKAQHAGLGAALIREVVAACRAAGGGAILLVGAEPFFRPLGFTRVPEARVRLPGPIDPARLLWLELRPGGLDHVAGEVTAPQA